MPPLRYRLAPLPLFVLAATASAQGSGDTGGFIVRLGTDTLALERYHRAPDELRGEIVLRVPDLRRVSYTATLTGGAIRGLDVAIAPVQHGTSAPSHGVMRFDGDTADVTIALADGTRRLRIPARPGAVPLTAFSHALIEQAILQARREGRDSVAFDWVGLGAPAASPSYVAVCGVDSVRLAFFGDPGYARLDRGGRILSLDGRGTTIKVEVERVPDVDLEHYEAAFAAEQETDGPMGPLSPRDTVRARIGGAELAVDYGRPRKRGREIFGGVVPWDRIWRLGANAATQFTTSAELEMSGRTVPAGTYSLFMLPSEGGAELIVNRQTGQWGTSYDPGRDLVRLPLLRESAPDPADQFTIEVEPSSKGGTLRLSWDTTTYSLPFTVRAARHAAGS